MKRGVVDGPKSPHVNDGKFLSPFLSSPPPPRFWFRKGSTQGSYFKAISKVFPYPNRSCNKVIFHIDLQINVIEIG